MTADEKLAADVRAYLATAGSIAEVRMFGGACFLLNGNMAAAVSKRGLLLRVGKDRCRDALARPGTRRMEMRGRLMEGYVYVDPLALDSDALKTWLDEASAFVKTLPPKAAKKQSARRGKPT
jgi:TfoX/Sxy family transcriptional regulator of competence genes